MRIPGSFNSKEYAYIDLQVFVMGKIIGGLRGIEYKTARKKEALIASGMYPRGIQKGEKTVEGTITLLQSEVKALNDAAKAQGYEDLLDIDFDIVVTYADEGALAYESDTIHTASITDLPKAMKQGDLYQEIALPFIACKVSSN